MEMFFVIALLVEFICLSVALYFTVKKKDTISKWVTVASLLSIIATLIGNYVFTSVPAPVIYPVNGQLKGDGVVEIKAESRFFDIYYSLDPFSDPKHNGKLYVGVIRLNESTTVLARARFLTKWSDLQMVEMQFPEESFGGILLATERPSEPTPIPTPEPTPEPTLKPTTVVPTGEISDSWEEILAAIDDGSAKQRYAVGAWKELNLGEYGTINMQLAGFNLDDRADGNGKAATTWIAKELLSKTHVLRDNWEKWRDNGWKGSDLRHWLQDKVLPAFPDALRDRLVPVKKYTDGGSQSAEDVLWIPSKPEVSGTNSLYYGLFQDKASNRAKKRNSSAAWWWLRSSYLYSDAYCVSTSGSTTSHFDVRVSGGVCIGFSL